MCEVPEKVFLIAFFTNLLCSLQCCFGVVSPRLFNVADEDNQENSKENSAWMDAGVWVLMVNIEGAKPCNDCNNIEGGAAQKW